MQFDWMTPYSPPGAATHASQTRIEMYRREVRDRAALLYRLGYSREQATARLQANADWDFDVGMPRPEELQTGAIAEIVATTFARRPAH